MSPAAPPRPLPSRWTAPGSPLRIVLASGAEALDLLDEDWDDLVRRQPLPNPTLASTWLRHLADWETGVPLVAVAKSGDVLLAGAALELRRPAGRFGPRVLTWLGPAAQLASPDLIVAPDRVDAGAELTAALLDEAHMLHVAGPSSGFAAGALATVAPWHRSEPIGERWIVPWPPARLGYAERRAAYETRWAERRGARIELRVAATPVDVTAALVRLFRVHRDRWHGRTDLNPRFAATARHRAWNRDVVAALAAGGGGGIAEVLENGRLLASCVGFVEGRGGLAHTQAMRSDGILREPGHIALQGCIRALGEAGATAIDLSVGGGHAGSPKTRLGSDSEPMLALLAASSAGRQRLLSGTRRLVVEARCVRRV